MAAKRGKRRLFGCAALAISSLFSLLFAEVALRLVWQPPSVRSDRAFGPHPVLGHAPLPGVSGIHATSEYEHPFRHNRQGLRAERDFSADRPPTAAKRILLLGDSFTYGLGSGDEDTFATLVDEALAGVETVNAGCNGYGQREELAVLETLGAALRPDLVVLVFFWNDLEDNLSRSSPAFADDPSGHPVRTDLEPAVLAAYDPLAIRQTDIPSDRPRPVSYLERLASEGLKGLRYRLFGIKARSIQDEKDRLRAWETTAALLATLKARIDGIGSQLLVVSMPDHNRVDPGARIRGIEPFHFEVEEELAKRCASLGIDYLDPTSAMRAAHAEGGEPLYYYADRHLTPAGNAAFAAAILPRLRERLGP